MELYVNQFNRSEAPFTDANSVNLKNLLSDINAEWIFSKDKYAQIEIDSFPGYTLVQKFELFLAHYSTKDCVETN